MQQLFNFKNETCLSFWTIRDPDLMDHAASFRHVFPSASWECLSWANCVIRRMLRRHLPISFRLLHLFGLDARFQLPVIHTKKITETYPFISDYSHSVSHLETMEKRRSMARQRGHPTSLRELHLWLNRIIVSLGWSVWCLVPHCNFVVLSCNSLAAYGLERKKRAMGFSLFNRAYCFSY